MKDTMGFETNPLIEKMICKWIKKLFKRSEAQ